MKNLVVVIAFIMAASPALAISRYNSLSMSCQAARASIHNEGAVILRYPSKRVSGMTLYDRYIRDSTYCDAHQYAAWTTIPTKDNPRCHVLNCQNIDNRDGMFIVPYNIL
ncbi:hypothetical protein [Rhizobium grahamii]|uniref:Uncharacterized protein n=1 Tax=Rhizobium grahamii TaxID=1120045 RepID=A0A370KT35_9HYPH|nr:hypothetical protein [Rhizobium grahamii]RDJ13822.1 hypothetical protein B5K06_07535 [Rhizobium grahamii]